MEELRYFNRKVFYFYRAHLFGCSKIINQLKTRQYD